jgi:hypothetical protein
MRHFLMYQYNGFPVEDKLIKDMSALVHGLDSCFSHTIPMFRRCHIFEALFTFRFCAEPSWLFTLRWCGMVVFFFLWISNVRSLDREQNWSSNQISLLYTSSILHVQQFGNIVEPTNFDSYISEQKTVTSS